MRRGRDLVLAECGESARQAASEDTYPLTERDGRSFGSTRHRSSPARRRRARRRLGRAPPSCPGSGRGPLDPDELPSPLLAGAASLLAFSCGALVPLLPYLIGVPVPAVTLALMLSRW